MPAIILAAFIFVPYYWRAGVYSVPEFLGRRYNPAVRAIQSLVWTVFLVVNLGAVFWAAAKMFEGLIGPLEWLPESTDARLFLYVGITAVITGVYTISGGLTAVVYTDAVQLVLMFLGAILVISLGLSDPEVGGISGLQQTIIERGHADHFTLFLPHDSKTPYPWTGVFLGLTLVLAPAYFIGNQAIVQRTLGARDEWNAKAGALFGGMLKFCIPFLVIIPGLIALVKYPDMGDGEKGYAMLVKEMLPTGIRGLVIAGFLAALMSSLDSIVTSAATILTRDFWVGLMKRPSDSRGLLRIGRWLTFALLIFGAATARLSVMFEGIYAAIQSMLSIFQGPTLAILLGGMFWRRATSKGAVASLVVGITLAISLHVYQKSTVSVVEERLGSAVVSAVYEDEGETSIGEIGLCRVENGTLRYRDTVEVSRDGKVVATGAINLLRPVEEMSKTGQAPSLGPNVADTSGVDGNVAVRVSIDSEDWKLPDKKDQKLRATDRIIPFESAAPFNAEEPFFAIAAIAFAASLLTLILVSLFTRPKTVEELRGLVYRASLHDDEAQAALAERVERLKDDAGEGETS
jgi:SSS family solute:Na+ symporter